MIRNFVNGRVYVFIDAANIFYSQKTLKWKVSYERLKAYFKTIILLSGDSDFAPVVDRVKNQGKRVIVMSVKGHISRELLERAKYVNLKKLRSEIELIDIAQK